jgi:hypothetical protein
MAHHRRDDRGAISAHVALLPAVLALFFTVMQVSLWYYGQSVATTAARHGLDAARVEHGDASAGAATTREFLDQVGGVRNARVGVQRSAIDVTVTVDAEPITILGLVDVPIRVAVSAPVERRVE